MLCAMSCSEWTGSGSSPHHFGEVKPVIRDVAVSISSVSVIHDHSNSSGDGDTLRPPR